MLTLWDTKTCTTCKKEKLSDQFRVGRRDCVECSKENCRDWYANNKEHARRYHASADRRARCKTTHLLRTYGLSYEDYEALVTKQKGRCAICRKKCVSMSAYRGLRGADGSSFRVDHCHKTGRVRGLLCVECNIGLGKFKDDAGLLKKAYEYLEK